MKSGRWRRWTTLAAALLVLDASLSFKSLWPTPAVRWEGELSIEFSVFLLALLVARAFLRWPSRSALRWWTPIWMLLVLGQYASVTATALFGRELNLYWDLRFIPGLTPMLTRATPLLAIAGSAVAALLVLVLLYRVFRWALGRVAEGLTDASERWAIGSIGGVIALLFVGQHLGLPADVPPFSPPVTTAYGHQARLIADSVVGTRLVPPSPNLDSDLAHVKGADVFLVFLELYGACAFDRPDMAPALDAARARLSSAIEESHRDVASAFVESPTFGGSSWLAHISLMSGIEVRDPDTNMLLMTEKRDTLVTTFARGGYRTLALMPGLWQLWPEGAFYHFNEIYGAPRLDYRGLQFGLFDIPDQFALAQIDVLEPSGPRFVFFPTVSTHMPFTPIPPYQPDWARMLTPQPYDSPDIVRAFSRQTDWLNLAPGYVEALTYDYDTIGGYLKTHADRDFVMIVIGDHQPAAVVSGEGAPWDVPVHVIASRRVVLDRLKAHGFRPGIAPARPILGRMHQLMPILLDAFGDARPPAVTSPADPRPSSVLSRALENRDRSEPVAPATSVAARVP